MRIDPAPQRVRAFLRGRLIFDTKAANLVYINGRPPEYFVPIDSVNAAEVVIGSSVTSDDNGLSVPLHATDGDCDIGRAFRSGPLAGLAHFEFDTLDTWFEEEEQIFGGPRDPYHRVDVLETARHLTIQVDDFTIASSTRPRLVLETGLPEQWYLPRIDVDWSALARSSHVTLCQYKGIAEWWHASVDGTRLENLAWGYERPIPSAPKLAGLLAFVTGHPLVTTFVDGTSLPQRRA